MNGLVFDAAADGYCRPGKIEKAQLLGCACFVSIYDYNSRLDRENVTRMGSLYLDGNERVAGKWGCLGA